MAPSSAEMPCPSLSFPVSHLLFSRPHWSKAARQPPARGGDNFRRESLAEVSRGKGTEPWKSTRYPSSRAAVGRTRNPAQRQMPRCNPRHHPSKKVSYPEKGPSLTPADPVLLTAPTLYPPSLQATHFFFLIYQFYPFLPPFCPQCSSSASSLPSTRRCASEAPEALFALPLCIQ